MLAEMKLGSRSVATVAHTDNSTLKNLTIQDTEGDWIFLTAPEVEELREMLNHWHDSGEAARIQRLADDELMARPADRDDIDEAEAAEEDVKLVRRVGRWRELTAAGRVYVHSLRMSAED